jgi:hypothetical protein
VRCAGVETLCAAVVDRFVADRGCVGCKGVGVDIVKVMRNQWYSGYELIPLASSFYGIEARKK